MRLHHGHRASRPTSTSLSCTVSSTARRFLAFLLGLGEGPDVGHRHAVPTEGSGGYLGPLPFVTPRAPNLPVRDRPGPVRVRFPRIFAAVYKEAVVGEPHPMRVV